MGVDDKATLAALDALVGRVEAAAADIVVTGAHLVQQLGMRLTHVRTGTLRRSWTVVGPAGGGGVFTAHVGPTMIYARRQELGFKGPDSLGRIFTNDPGWPYVRPAGEAAVKPMQALAVDRIRKAASG